MVRTQIPKAETKMNASNSWKVSFTSPRANSLVSPESAFCNFRAIFLLSIDTGTIAIFMIFALSI